MVVAPWCAWVLTWSYAAGKAASAGAVQGAGEDEARWRKREHLSNIKFIGELGKLDLLHGQILHLCIKELLDRKSSTWIKEKAEDLECLCQMMRIIGKALDSRPDDKVSTVLHSHSNYALVLMSPWSFHPSVIVDLLSFRRYWWMTMLVISRNTLWTQRYPVESVSCA